MNAANDVREGVARAIRKGFLGGMDGYDPSYEDYDMADAVMAAFDVRPRRTITDADAKEEAVTLAYNEVTGADGDEWSPDRTLAALNALWNAAREVRS
jgi:predicted NAD-dependent protein-ADP-ribosyltransferase YbiA (DUF1768 family)